MNPVATESGIISANNQQQLPPTTVAENVLEQTTQKQDFQTVTQPANVDQETTPDH